MRIGVLGVGSLAEYLIRGAEGVEFVLSPRSAERVARLGYPVVGSNQELINECDEVLVCLPAVTGLTTLWGLKFRAGQSVCSAMAGVSLESVHDAVAPARACVAMMPGHANAYRMGPSVLYPADPIWAAFLGRVGPVHELESAQDFAVAAVFGAMSGASVVMMRQMIDWFAAQGLDPGLARRLVAQTLRGNAEVLLHAPETLDDIVRGVATPGGITEHLVGVLAAGGGLKSWNDGLDSVLRRIAVGSGR